MRSFYDIVGFPPPISSLIVTLVIIFAIAPYLEEDADFGIFKVPKTTGKARPILKVLCPILVLLALLGYAPAFETAGRIQLDPGHNISYSAGAPPTRSERWLKNLANYLEDLNLDLEPSPKFQVLVLETRPFEDDTRRLSLEIVPIPDKLSIDMLYLFRCREDASDKSYQPLKFRMVGKGAEASDIRFDKGDTLICILDLRSLEDPPDFPSTSPELDSSFKIVVK